MRVVSVQQERRLVAWPSSSSHNTVETLPHSTNMACVGDDQNQAADRLDYASDISFLKFKYGLQNLFASLKMLKEREAASRHDLQILGERHKKLEAAHSEEVVALQSEITLKNQDRHNLETEVQDLRRDSALKNAEINNLKEELKALMDARNELAENLKALNYNLECKLEEKTRELVVLVEKHNRHSVLLEAIEKEAFAVRESVDETNAYIQQKEEEVFCFQKNLLKALDFESTFLERIDYLEQRLKAASSNLNKKNELVVALEKKLDAAANDHTVEAERAIFKETLEAKDSLILMSQQEKQVLLENLKNYETMIERLQTSVTQQDQLVVKYQHEVLALQKESDFLKRVLTETERSLSEAAEENKKLRDEMQEQKHGFTVQAAQLCKDAKVALKEKLSKLKVKLMNMECLLTEKVAGDKERYTNRYQASARDAERQEVVIETCQNCSQDLFENVHDPSGDTIKNPQDLESFAELDQEPGLDMNCSQPLVSFLELEDNDVPDGIDQTRHLFGGNNHVPNMPCNEETAKESLSEVVRIQSMLPIDVPPCLSNNNPGKEGLPLEAVEDSTPQINNSMTKSVTEMSNSGLDVQFRHSSLLRTDPKSSMKKAHVLTSANECFCNTPSYGYMVNCKICGAHFHAACIRLEGMKPGETYTCATCNEQPNRKRRQVQIIK